MNRTQAEANCVYAENISIERYTEGDWWVSVRDDDYDVLGRFKLNTYKKKHDIDTDERAVVRLLNTPLSVLRKYFRAFPYDTRRGCEGLCTTHYAPGGRVICFYDHAKHGITNFPFDLSEAHYNELADGLESETTYQIGNTDTQVRFVRVTDGDDYEIAGFASE